MAASAGGNHGFSWMGGINSSSSEAITGNSATLFNPLSSSSTPAFLRRGIAAGVESEHQRSDMEMQMLVVNFLKAVPDREPVGADRVLQATGVDLAGPGGAVVRRMLENNPKVQVEGGLYSYVAKHNVHNRSQLLTLVERARMLTWEEVRDAYAGVGGDLDALVRSGEVICLESAETRQRVFYPRGRPFLTRVGGGDLFEVRPRNPVAEPGPAAAARAPLELRRGDAVLLSEPPPPPPKEEGEGEGAAAAGPPAAAAAADSDDEGDPLLGRKHAGLTGGRARWFRVVVGGGAAAPLSASSVRAPRKGKHEVPNFAAGAGLPLDGLWPFGEEGAGGGGGGGGGAKRVRAYKYGCSNDLRALWEEAGRDMPQADADLERALERAGFALGGRAPPKRPKRFQRQKEKKKRKASLRRTKETNAHLAGSRLAAALDAYELEKFQEEQRRLADQY